MQARGLRKGLERRGIVGGEQGIDQHHHAVDHLDRGLRCFPCFVIWLDVWIFGHAKLSHATTAIPDFNSAFNRSFKCAPENCDDYAAPFIFTGCNPLPEPFSGMHSR